MRNLFAQNAVAIPEPKGHRSPFDLRGYQAEDVDAVLDAWAAGKRGVVCCWATGLGKSVFFAELSKRVTEGRVLVVVDTTKLAMDLYQTIIKHHGTIPGVLTGDLKSHWQTARVVVATIQSLYAGKLGDETYRMIDPNEFAAVLIDECESSLADQFGATMLYFMDGNPALKIAGASATPFRMDGRDMGELYDHCAPNDPRTGRPAIGTLNRNLKWAVMEGWLVKPRQAFLTCNVDFSSIKIRKQGDGERDWSEKDIARLLLDQDEQELRQMAEGIHHLAGDQQSIVVCPNNVDVCKMVAGHLCGAAGDDTSAQAIYGDQGEYGRDLLDAHSRGEFQHAVTCKMAEKGYDNDTVVYAFMLRKTRSRRLYEQIMGRTCRPLAGIRAALAAAPDAEARRAIIEQSDKPVAAMVDLVGVHPDAKDMGVIDIIGDYLPEELRRRTMELMHEKDQNLPEPGSFEDDEEVLPGLLDVGAVAREAKDDLAEQKRREEAAERRRRSMIQVTERNVNVEWTDDLGAQGNGRSAPKPRRGSSTAKQAQLLIAFGVRPETALAASKGQAGKMIDSYKRKEAAGGPKPDYRLVRKFERQGGLYE